MNIWRKQIISMAVRDAAMQPTSVAEALIAVREAIQLHASDGSGMEYVRSPVRLLCAFARHDNMPPERLLVELKHTLNAGPTSVALERRDDLRRRVVAFAIQSYFGIGD